jgi:hypothetical protein
MYLLLTTGTRNCILPGEAFKLAPVLPESIISNVFMLFLYNQYLCLFCGWFVLENIQSVKEKRLQPLRGPSTLSNELKSRKVFSGSYVFASRCLMTDLNNVLRFHAHVLTGWLLSHI